jgi:hypothetical protein
MMRSQLHSERCSSPRRSLAVDRGQYKMSQTTSEPGSRVSIARMVGFVACVIADGHRTIYDVRSEVYLSTAWWRVTGKGSRS